ncbi:AI-2E family transporter [Oceaniglobus roseus]|uniref:AI-2E family transporter n=1 Tax=Oceaniglobus roseus TaxID=1737570 RepID=UPI0012FFF0F4|nr:AI-2E family transporter [Kandeliimicrobium roseum]
MPDDSRPLPEGPRRFVPRARAVQWLLLVIAAILTGWALRAVESVAVTVVLSFFLALAVQPVDRMAAERLPRRAAWLGHLLALSVVVVVVLAFLGSLWVAAGQVIERFDHMDIMELLPDAGLEAATGNEGEDPLGRVYANALRSLASTAVEQVPMLARSVVDMAGTTLGGLILILFMTLMMLIEARQWQMKSAAVLPDGGTGVLRDSLSVVAVRLRRYLLTRAVLGLLTGGLYALWLWPFGLDLLFVWALLAFLLNFVPTIGSLLSGILPVLYAFLQKDPGQAFLIGGGIFVIEQVMGNYVDPRMQGRQISVSPLVILVVLLFWTWFWGAIGAVLAVPMIMTLIIVLTQFRVALPVALLLSSETSYEDLERVASGRQPG